MAVQLREWYVEQTANAGPAGERGGSNAGLPRVSGIGDTTDIGEGQYRLTDVGANFAANGVIIGDVVAIQHTAPELWTGYWVVGVEIAPDSIDLNAGAPLSGVLWGTAKVEINRDYHVGGSWGNAVAANAGDIFQLVLNLVDYTFQQVADDGLRINVKEGTYSPAASITPRTDANTSLNVAGWFYVQGYASTPGDYGKPLIDVTHADHGIKLTNYTPCQHWLDFKVTGVTSAGKYGVAITYYARPNWTMSRFEIYSCYYGVFCNTAYCIISDFVIHDCTLHGVRDVYLGFRIISYDNGASGFQYPNGVVYNHSECVAYGNTDDGFEFCNSTALYGYGIHKFNNNLAYNNGRHGFHFNMDFGTYPHTFPVINHFYGNLSLDNGDAANEYGYYLDPDTYKIFNELVENCQWNMAYINHEDPWNFILVGVWIEDENPKLVDPTGTPPNFTLADSSPCIGRSGPQILPKNVGSVVLESRRDIGPSQHNEADGITIIHAGRGRTTIYKPTVRVE